MQAILVQGVQLWWSMVASISMLQWCWNSIFDVAIACNIQMATCGISISLSSSSSSRLFAKEITWFHEEYSRWVAWWHGILDFKTWIQPGIMLRFVLAETTHRMTFGWYSFRVNVDNCNLERWECFLLIDLWVSFVSSFYEVRTCEMRNSDLWHIFCCP